MPSFKEPSFQDRTAAAAKAKADALAKLRSKPPVDENELADRRARAEAKEAAKAEAARLKQQARKEAQAARAEKAKAAEEAAAAARPVELTEAEKKAARDARYAARKNRKK
jgi:alpha-beta hydrolase superfamily lysophospholipase